MSESIQEGIARAIEAKQPLAVLIERPTLASERNMGRLEAFREAARIAREFTPPGPDSPLPRTPSPRVDPATGRSILFGDTIEKSDRVMRVTVSVYEIAEARQSAGGREPTP